MNDEVRVKYVLWETVRQDRSKSQKDLRAMGIDPSQFRNLVRSGQVAVVHKLPEAEPEK